MAIPSALKAAVLRQRKAHGASQPSGTGDASNKAGEQPRPRPTKAQIRRSTKPRRISIAIAFACFILAFLFNLMVVVGNINKNQRALTNIYFYKLDLADIIPASVPNADLINSIARTVGLHDFYQVGMWGFCEGYINEGITDCSKPQNLYWFNPVDVLMNELLAGATIALPSAVVEILTVLRIASKVMFGCFITSLVMNFVLIFAAPVALLSHWWSVPVGFAAFLANVLLFCGAVIATVTSLAFKYAAMSQSDLNISAEVGVAMFVLMWLAFGFGWLAFIIHAGLGCCCRSVRDVQRGRKPIVEPENELGPRPGDGDDAAPETAAGSGTAAPERKVESGAGNAEPKREAAPEAHPETASRAAAEEVNTT